MMKRLALLAISCLLTAYCTKGLAAPPLRGLMPMKLADGTVLTPMGAPVAHKSLEGICLSSQAIGSGSYLQHTGSPRILTILAAFQDVGFTVSSPVEAFDQYLNADVQQNMGNANHLNQASVRQYFETCSHGQFSPQFDVVGPVVLPEKMAYYGGKNATGTDERFYDFCRDAMEQAKPLVNDWSQYDNDRDGMVELVCVIYAGFGQNQDGSDSTIWAKAAYEGLKVTNSLRIARFNCSPELFHPRYPSYINGTGVFIHEMSHCMGLPDFYATQSRAYVNNQSMESWSLMDYGCYNRNGFAPCPYTAWEQEVMGWTEIEELTPTADRQQYITDLLPLIEGGKAYKLSNSQNSRDYIVFENMQQRGLNAYAEGHGLLAYHVDYPYATVNMADSPNNNPGHPSMAVVPAGGVLINSYLRGSGKTYSREEWMQSLQSSVFPGIDSVATLTDRMQIPNYCFYNGSRQVATGFMLTDITEDIDAGTVSFQVAIDDPTGVSLSASPAPSRQGIVYDLLGRRLLPLTSHPSPLKKGIYIVDGRKVVVR